MQTIYSNIPTKKDSPAVAVIGTGYWGKNLVRNYHEIGVLKVICDRDEITLANFKKQYPDIEVCLAFNEVLRHEDIKGIVIATPAETHFALAVRRFWRESMFM